jgi:hypothetical protein
VQHGDVEGALRVASWACVRSPLLLFTILVFLVGALGLASWLLPQHPLTSVLRQASRRQGGERGAMHALGALDWTVLLDILWPICPLPSSPNPACRLPLTLRIDAVCTAFLLSPRCTSLQGRGSAPF